MPGPGTSREQYTPGAPAAKKRARRTVVNTAGATTTRSGQKATRKARVRTRRADVARIAKAYDADIPKGQGRSKDDPGYKLVKGERAVRRTKRSLDDEGGFDPVDAVKDVLGTEIPGTEFLPDPSTPTGRAEKRSTVGDVAALVPATKGAKIVSAASKLKRGTKAASAASKASRTASKARTGVRKATPAPVKKGAQKAARSKPAKAAKKVSKSKPVRVGTTPFRHPGKTTAAVIAGPGAVKATQTGDTKDFKAPLTATAKALADVDTYKTTARSLPGLVTAPIGIAANVGLTGYRATQTAIPGGKSYSGKEIAEPTKKAADETYQFGKGMVETFGSGDEKRIEKAIEEEYGLTPFIMAGVPGAKGLRGLGAGAAAGRAARKVPGVRKIPEAAQRSRARREVSRDVAMAQRKAASRALGKPARKAKNERPGLITIKKKLQKAENKRGTLRNRKEKVTPEHRVNTLAEQGIRTEAHLKQFRKKHGKRNPEAPDERIVAADLAADLDAKKISDPAVLAAVEDYAKFQKPNESSPVAKNIPQAVTWDIALPWERTTKVNGRSVKYFDNPKTKEQRAVNSQIEGAFLKDMETLRRREGLAEPVWTSDKDVLRRAPQGSPGSVQGYRGRTSYAEHQNRAKLQKAGLADQSFESFAQHSIIAPSVKRAVNENTARFSEKEGLTYRVKGKDQRVFTEKEVDKLVRDGDIDTDKVAVMDGQQFKAALLDPTISKANVAAFTKALDKETREMYARKNAGDPSAKGRIYVAIDKTKLHEFLKQHHRPEDDFGKILAKTQRGASRALLGYSPSWLVAQPIAEGAQGLAAVGPVAQLRGLYEYKKMTPKEKQEFDSAFGPTAGTGDIRDVSISMELEPPVWKRVEALRRSRSGRVAHGVLTGRYANDIDRAKGTAIRRSVAAGKLIKEYDKFRLGMKGLISEGMRRKDLSREELFRYYAKNPEAQKKLEAYVDDVMGNWQALTARERSLSKVVIFYPFVRMSLAWTFKTFPKQHPYKTAILHFLAQQNASVLERTYGGDPSFFSQYANAPIYGGEDGEVTGLLPMSRIAPGSNTLIEAAGGERGTVAGVARSLNPLLGAFTAGVTGQDPQTGRDINFGKNPTDRQRLGAAATQFLSLPTPVRAANTLTGDKARDFLLQKQETKLGKLFDAMNEPRGKRVVRSFAAPFLPYEAAKQRMMTDVGRLVDIKYNGKTSGERSRAADLLDKMYRKFGIED